MINPHIIIGVPTYNRSHLIERVVESVTSQDYENWSILFVDDFSQDGTKEVVSKFCQKENNIYYFRMPENSGVNAVRNTIVAEAKKLDDSAFLLLIDDDDYLAPGCLANAAKAILHNPDYHWFTLNCLGENGQRISKLKKYGRLSYLDDYMFGRNLKGDLTHIVRLSIIGEVRFSDQFKNAEVWFFWSNLAAKFPLFAVNKTGSIKEYLPEGITQSGFNRDRAIEVLKYKIEKLSPFVAERLLIHQYVSLVKYLIASGKKDEAKSWLKRAFKLNPFYLRQYRYWLYLLR